MLKASLQESLFIHQRVNLKKIIFSSLIFLSIIFGLVYLFKSCSSNMTERSRLYTIARTNIWPSLDLLGKEPNMLAFMTDLVTDIAEMEQLRISLVTLNNANLFEMLKESFYDGVLMVITPDSYIENNYVLSKPIYQAGPVLLVPFDSKAENLKDLKGKGIGIKTNSSIIFKLNQLAKTPILVSYDNMIKALDDLANHYLGGVILDAELAYTYSNGFYKGQIKVATKPLTDIGIRLVAHKNQNGETLVNYFNEGLDKLKQDDSYQKMLQKWGLALP